MPRCVFCRILEGAAPASIVYDDATAIALLDLHPIHQGHALVIPRQHVADLASCPDELAAHLFAVSRRIAPAIVRATRADGFNVWTANGRAAGQDVMHLHLHVLPRRRDDTFGLRFPKGYPDAAHRPELDALARRITGFL